MSRLLFLFAIALALTTSAGAQSVTIVQQADTGLRLFATYRTASGAAVSTRPIVWAVVNADSGRVQIVPIPGTSWARYVRVIGIAAGSVSLQASATVSGRMYADTLGPIIVVPQYLARIARVDSVHVRAVQPVTGAPFGPWGRSVAATIEVGRTAQICTRLFALGRIIQESCGAVGGASPLDLAQAVWRGDTVYVIGYYQAP